MKMVQSGILFVVYLIALVFMLDWPLEMISQPSNVQVGLGVGILAGMAWVTYIVGKQLLYKNILLPLEEK